MIIELDATKKRYGSFEALAGISVAVRPGTIGLLGPNGAGKSTLIKGLLGLVKFSSGTAKVMGLDVATQASQIREVIGYMPEDDCSIAGLKGVQAVALAGELAGLPARTSLRRAHEILDYVLLGEARYRETQTYSTGMRQKVKLAQALIHAPKILFLDEPTNGLDPAGREKMLKLIRSLSEKRGISVVISTHILTDVENCCDSALILGRGRLLVYDTIAELQRSVDMSSRVRVLDRSEVLAEELKTRGAQVDILSADELKVSGTEASIADSLGKVILAASASCGVVVREILSSRNSLEDIYLKAVRETEQDKSEPATRSLEHC